MTEPTLFDQTEPTVLAELERVVKDALITRTYDDEFSDGYNAGLEHALSEINRRKPAEIDQLKQAFAEGGGIPQSAESWVKKFRQQPNATDLRN